MAPYRADDPRRIYLAVAVGSALGAVLRHGAGLGALALAGSGFPWGTLVVNVAGSFVIGGFAALVQSGGPWASWRSFRPLVMAGFCGGLTTFSVFSVETLTLLQDGRGAVAGANVAASLLLWVPAAWAGYALARRFAGRRGTAE